jgi:hypothetical protein
MTWAKCLKRVFGIDITTCVHCGGAVRIVASIEEPIAILATSRSTVRWSERTTAGSTRTAGGTRMTICRPQSLSLAQTLVGGSSPTAAASPSDNTVP